MAELAQLTVSPAYMPGAQKNCSLPVFQSLLHFKDNSVALESRNIWGVRSPNQLLWSSKGIWSISAGQPMSPKVYQKTQVFAAVSSHMVTSFVCISKSFTNHNLKKWNYRKFSCRCHSKIFMYDETTSVFLNQTTRNLTSVFPEVLLKFSFNSLMLETSPGWMPVLITCKW